MTDLERRYRRLLRVYPRWYRQRRGEEMLSTLMDGSFSGQQRPRAVEACGLIVRGSAMRLDLGEEGALGALAAHAASPLLASAAVLSLVALVFGELGTVHQWMPQGRIGPFLTVGWVAYVAWIGAAAVDLATASRWQRPAVAVAVAVTVAMLPLGDAASAGRPPLFVLATLTVLGVPALVRPGWAHARPARGVLTGVVATVLLLTGAGISAALGQPHGWPFGVEGFGFYQVWLGVVAAWAPVIALATAAAAGVLARARRSEAAATLVLWLVPWLVLSVGHAARQSTALVSLALFGALAAALAGSAAHSQVRLARRRTLPR